MLSKADMLLHLAMQLRGQFNEQKSRPSVSTPTRMLAVATLLRAARNSQVNKTSTDTTETAHIVVVKWVKDQSSTVSLLVSVSSNDDEIGVIFTLVSITSTETIVMLFYSSGSLQSLFDNNEEELQQLIRGMSLSLPLRPSSFCSTHPNSSNHCLTKMRKNSNNSFASLCNKMNERHCAT